MKQLWAPWRFQFINEKKKKGCIFCLFPRQKNDRENLIIHRGKKSFVILNKYPYNCGHLMVVPYQHTAQLKKLDSVTLVEMMRTVDLSVQYLTQTLKSQGHNIGLNLGLAGGAGIADHLHIHVVPRWAGDTNFMPVLADTKVMVDHLYDTYDRLFPLFNKNKSSPS